MERHHYLNIGGVQGFHEIHYLEWGEAANPKVLVCAHGLTRCAHDFDVLAQALSDHYRVICPDAAGRGESQWLTQGADYSYPQYLADTQALLAHLGAKEVHWVGTSMGGMLGMLLASLPQSPVTRMVVNDVGPLIPKEALQRIAGYVGANPSFASFEDAMQAIRAASPFGLSDEQWLSSTHPLVKQNEAGRWVFRYDPAIGDVFRAGPIQDVNLGAVWDAIRCPMLVTRGAESDLLLRKTYEEMLAKPNVRGVEFPGIGHAPMFMSEDQISAVRNFLLA